VPETAADLTPVTWNIGIFIIVTPPHGPIATPPLTTLVVEVLERDVAGDHEEYPNHDAHQDPYQLLEHCLCGEDAGNTSERVEEAFHPWWGRGRAGVE